MISIQIPRLLAVLGTVISLTGCVIVENPPRTDCMPEPNPYTYDPGNWHCQIITYSEDGTRLVTRDLITSMASAQEAVLQAQARHYASKFSLSEEQGLKIARTVTDFAALKTRSDADIADFATRLYGVSPSRIVSAAGRAQAGDATELNGLVAEAAKSFETTPENMKRIVKSLHGELLKEQGIHL